MDFIKTIKSLFRSDNNKKADYEVVSNSWSKDEIFEFTQNLNQVIDWTKKLSENFDFQNGKYGTVFRQTNPEINGSKLYTFNDDYATWTNEEYSFDNYDLLLSLALEKRTSVKPIGFSNLGNLGRILSFQTCITTHDGTPMAESRHFVDSSDVPPIDTWFYLKRNYFHERYMCQQTLFCWIPKEFEQVMQDANDVEILASYQWLDENDKEIYDRIKNGE